VIAGIEVTACGNPGHCPEAFRLLTRGQTYGQFILWRRARMVLAASDEMRHPYDGLFNWRESLYFNFADRTHGLGGWFYLWVVPNKPLNSGMLVSIYKGMTDRRDANDLALHAPGHRYIGDNGNWVYCFKKDTAALIAADFDDVELCGLRLVRDEPLRSYRITFEDDAGTRMDLSGKFPMNPYDYADGAHRTPAWVAKNRYHRTWKVNGKLLIAGNRYDIDTTGDSDHSWGNRDMEVFSRHTFKMWSFQTPDARRSVSVIEQGADLYLGFVNIDGDVRSVQTIKQSGRYTKSGVQHDIEVTIIDTAGRSVHARMQEMFSVIGHGEPFGLWGFEGVGSYAVDGWGACTGVASYFWPPEVTPVSLHNGVPSLA
jgi:hypothetical protein